MGVYGLFDFTGGLLRCDLVMLIVSAKEVDGEEIYIITIDRLTPHPACLLSRTRMHTYVSTPQ